MPVPTAQTTGYELLTADTVPAYVADQPRLAQLVDPLTLVVSEVGDGNLNLVFLCRDGRGRGLCLKQALPYVRLVGADWPLTPKRAVAEARSYQLSTRVAPEYVPRFYGLDVQRYIVAMEALLDWAVWRSALNDGRAHPEAGPDMGCYIARIAFGTSVFGLEAGAHKAQLAEAINPELCKITEDLVFTEPYVDHPHNSYAPGVAPAVERLRADNRIAAAVQALKYTFMTHAESLVHGDLHTGSVMVSPRGGHPARAIDPEFCFYGPVSFDIGALFGNYLLARVRAEVLGRPTSFRDWVRGLPQDTWQAFESEMWRQWPGRADASFGDGFLNDWLGEVLREAVGFGGCKAIRRIIGLAKASDIQTLDGPLHVAAASAALRTARRWLLERASLNRVADLVALTDDSLAESLAQA
ncbi:MAG: S-methyl-5-thioribose kinase [Chloroflexota bacterium]